MVLANQAQVRRRRHAEQFGGGTDGELLVDDDPKLPLVRLETRAPKCLALAPAAATGDGSGRFEVNAMYVTGTISSVALNGHTAVLHGTANVTGLGAGHNLPFTATVQSGGPGSTVTLEISGLTFHEILLEGQINIKQS